MSVRKVNITGVYVQFHAYDNIQNCLIWILLNIDTFIANFVTVCQLLCSFWAIDYSLFQTVFNVMILNSDNDEDKSAMVDIVM